MSNERKIRCRECGNTTYELTTDEAFQNAKLACEECGEVLPILENQFTGTRVVDRTQK